jgi:hypothetical protein
MFRVVSRFEAFPMKRIHPRRLVLRFALSAFLAALCSWVPVPRAVAQDLSGFSVMLQRGDTYHPDAIEIAPNGSWFLTARGGAIYLSDVESGAVLRAIIPPVTIGRVAISKDGRDIFAEAAPYEQPGVFGWRAETGAPISNAQTVAPAADDPGWNWIYRWWPSRNGPPENMNVPEKYLFDRDIARLVDVERVERVEPTNRENIVQVTVAGAFAAYHYYFIDIIQRRIVADVAGKTLNTFCGQPHGAFAFDGRYLIVAPTELDASSSFVNSIVIDTSSNPPALKWGRPCQNWQFAGIEMDRGLITVSPPPDKQRVWDPATARPLAVLDDIYDSFILTWSRDLTTFATGFHETLENRGNKFGVSVLRSGKKLFLSTDQEVKEIRFNPDGSVVFARTEGGWAAWGTSKGEHLAVDIIPPSEMDFRAADSREATSPDGKFRIVDGRELIDVASGRILVKAPYLNLSSGSRYVWATAFESNASRITVWDAASGQQLWTATANDGESEDFLLMEFPDGRVRLSKGAEPLVKLVRGFEVRPFDDAARKAFVRP